MIISSIPVTIFLSYTDGPPTIVAAMVLSPRSIKVTWNPLPANSFLTNYTISYDGVESFADDGSKTIDQSTTSTTINGLEEFVSYDITVQALYSGGRGISSTEVRVTTISDSRFSKTNVECYRNSIRNIM